MNFLINFFNLNFMQLFFLHKYISKNILHLKETKLFIDLMQKNCHILDYVNLALYILNKKIN